MSIKELDKPLKPLSRMTPISPLSAKAPTGEAMIEFLVDEDGKVYLPRIVSATEPCYGYAAIQAVASWRFEEPTKQGISVVVRAKVPIRFSVKK